MHNTAVVVYHAEGIDLAMRILLELSFSACKGKAIACKDSYNVANPGSGFSFYSSNPESRGLKPRSGIQVILRIQDLQEWAKSTIKAHYVNVYTSKQTLSDIFSLDTNIIIPVWPALFMPKTQSVT